MQKGKMPGRIGRGSSNLPTELKKSSEPLSDSSEVARPPVVRPPRKKTVRQALEEMEARIDASEDEAES